MALQQCKSIHLQNNKDQCRSYFADSGNLPYWPNYFPVSHSGGLSQIAIIGDLSKTVRLTFFLNLHADAWQAIIVSSGSKSEEDLSKIATTKIWKIFILHQNIWRVTWHRLRARHVGSRHARNTTAHGTNATDYASVIFRSALRVHLRRTYPFV